MKNHILDLIFQISTKRRCAVQTGKRINTKFKVMR